MALSDDRISVGRLWIQGDHLLLPLLLLSLLLPPMLLLVVLVLLLELVLELVLLLLGGSETGPCMILDACRSMSNRSPISAAQCMEGDSASSCTSACC